MNRAKHNMQKPPKIHIRKMSTESNTIQQENEFNSAEVPESPEEDEEEECIGCETGLDSDSAHRDEWGCYYKNCCCADVFEYDINQDETQESESS